MDAAATFLDRLRRNAAGEPVGVVSVCSAHPLVLDAAMQHARATGGMLLVEATCNQVNQEGGYTGLTPAAFRDRLRAQAAALALAPGALLLGGDHLGPNPWRGQPAETAMAQAAELVAAYAAAGYRKLHLDASMACAGDPTPLPPEVIAARAADLAAIAEREAASGEAPLYVVGTEVPTPGGARAAEATLLVTRPADVDETIELHRAAFRARGIEAALDRIVAIVVQPGVEFGQDSVHDFAPAGAGALSAALAAHPGLVFEAHSTDYQREAALHALVAGHFAILKVGPELTFALREAVFALDAIARELGRSGGVRAALETAMTQDPKWWRGYHDPTDRLALDYSFSDRIRYYWPAPPVAAALHRLLDGLAAHPIPPALVSQYLPAAFAAWRERRLALDAPTLIGHRIGAVLERYGRAAGR